MPVKILSDVKKEQLPFVTLYLKPCGRYGDWRKLLIEQSDLGFAEGCVSRNNTRNETFDLRHFEEYKQLTVEFYYIIFPQDPAAPHGGRIPHFGNHWQCLELVFFFINQEGAGEASFILKPQPCTNFHLNHTSSYDVTIPVFQLVTKKWKTIL